jgi:hypothetical protein
MIRLSSICLLAFLVSVGIFVHAWLTQGDSGFAFLLMGAIGCAYLLILGEQHHSSQLQYRSMPGRLLGIQRGALSVKTMQTNPPPTVYARDRRRRAENKRWPDHLERRKSARAALAPMF